jgi:hypothetical protein
MDTSDFVFALTVYDDGSGAGPALCAGGRFASMEGVAAIGVASWDCSSWSPLGSGLGVLFSRVTALEVFDDQSGAGAALFAGFNSAGGVAARSIARWDGSSWSALGTGFTAEVSALAVFDDGNGGGPALCAGGSFLVSPAGDSYIAKWGCPAPTPVTLFCTAKAGLQCGPLGIGAEGTSSATAGSGFVVSSRPALSCKYGVLLYDASRGPASPFGPERPCSASIGAAIRRRRAPTFPTA